MPLDELRPQAPTICAGKGAFIFSARSRREYSLSARKSTFPRAEALHLFQQFEARNKGRNVLLVLLQFFAQSRIRILSLSAIFHGSIQIALCRFQLFSFLGMRARGGLQLLFQTRGFAVSAFCFQFDCGEALLNGMRASCRSGYAGAEVRQCGFIMRSMMLFLSSRFQRFFAPELFPRPARNMRLRRFDFRGSRQESAALTGFVHSCMPPCFRKLV